MAYRLTGADDLERLDTGGVTGYPYTMVVWFNPDSATGFQQLMGMGDTDSVSYQQMWLRPTGSGQVLRGIVKDSTLATGAADSATTYNVGAWNHACMVTSSATNRLVYLGGIGGTPNTTNVAFDGLIDNFTMGRRKIASGYSLPFTGQLAGAALWNVALTVSEVATLAAGYSPLLIRPQALISYYPLFSALHDPVGGYGLTNTGSALPNYGHAPMIHPGSNILPPWVETVEVEHEREGELPGTGGFSVIPTVTSNVDHGKLMDLPGGTHAIGWRVGDHIGTDPRYSVSTPVVMPDLLGGGSTPMNVPPLPRQEVNGQIKAPVHDFWYEHIHLLPRLVQDFVNLLSDETFDIELHNADRINDIQVNSITNNLNPNATIVGIPATPFTVKSHRSITAVVTVLADGPFTIDADYTFHCSDGEDYTFYITGSRIVLFPIRPEAPLREHLIWETKILTTVVGGEQRIANRETPRGEFEFTIKDGIQQAEIILFDRQSKMLAVPAWHEPSFLTSSAAIDDLTISVDETRYSNLYAYGYAVIFQDIHTFDTLQILSLTSTSITFITGLTVAFDSNTQVMPLMLAWAEVTTPISKAVYNDETISLKLSVPATPTSLVDIADASAFSTYNSKVFLDDPNYLPDKQLQEALRTKVYVLDNSTGDRSQFSLWQRSVRNSGKGFKTNTRKELWELRQLLHFLKGQQVSFYIPTFTKDLEPISILIYDTDTFDMANIGYFLNVDERWPKQVFRMHLKDGTILIRTILSSSKTSTSVEQLIVDIVWPYNIEPNDIERIEFLTKIRFATDDITIIHDNALGWAKCVVPTVEVTDDDV